MREQDYRTSSVSRRAVRAAGAPLVAIALTVIVMLAQAHSQPDVRRAEIVSSAAYHAVNCATRSQISIPPAQSPANSIPAWCADSKYPVTVALRG